MFSRQFWSIKYVSTAEFPHGRFPLVFLNGKPGYVINQWIYYMIDADVGQSLLEERIRAVLHLYDYCMARYGDRVLTQEESVALVGDFLLTKRDGTDLSGGKNPLGLNWRPAHRTTLKRYLAALNEFDIWHAWTHQRRA